MVRFEFSPRIESALSQSPSDPTVAEILSDSIVQALMEADGVDPEVLEAQLQSMARELLAIRHAEQNRSNAAKRLSCRD
jgi:hypothetical protein